MSIGPNVETVSQLKELSDYNTGGTRLGQSATDYVSFWGVATVVQSASANQATIASTASTGGYSLSSGVYQSVCGFTTTAQADALIGRVNEIVQLLTRVGLWKGSA